MILGIISLLILVAFCYTVYCVFKKGKPFRYRLKMLAITFIALPITFAVTGMIAQYNDPERYAQELEAALAKAEATSEDAEIIRVLEDFKEDEKVTAIITAARLREVIKLPSSDIEGNLEGYEELAELLPSDAAIQERVTFYATKLAEEEQAKRLERESRRAENEAIKEANQTRKILESNQVAYCKQIIETSAKFPTKADFDIGHEYFRKGEKGNVVTGRVELMNGFGVLIPHKYSCEFEGTTLIKADAVPG